MFLLAILLFGLFRGRVCLYSGNSNLQSRTRFNRIKYLSSNGAADFYMEDTDEINRAKREEQTMLLAQRIKFEEIPFVSVAGLVGELRSRGVVRINDLLSSDEMLDLLRSVNEQWAYSVSQVVEINERNNYFSNSKSQVNRWDCKLLYSDVIDRTMRSLLRSGSLLGDTLHDMMGNDGRITELAAFITTPGSGRQIVHSDTSWSNDFSYTCTVALQDVDETMGPTVFIPSTHTEEVYLERVTEFMNEEYMTVKDSKLLDLPHTLSMLNAGSVAVYDSRLLHCGSANRSANTRVLFYFTISSPLSTDEEDFDKIFDPDGIISDERICKSRDSSISRENIGYTLKQFR